MKADLYHIQINVRDPKISFPFYKNLMSFLGYEVTSEGFDYLSLGDGISTLWLISADEKNKDVPFNRKNIGLNHLAFKVNSKEKVDLFVKEFLLKKQIPPLYDSPKLFPEYHKDYYSVYFEDPDRIKLEVLYRSSEKVNDKDFTMWHKDKSILQTDKKRPFFHEA